jgi:hypothetical protein
MLSSVYHLVARFGPPAAYNYWAVLGLDIFFVVMWLCSFALLAARVGGTFAVVGDYYSYSYLSDFELVWLATQAAAAGLGGLELYVSRSRPFFPSFPRFSPRLSLTRPSASSS